MARWIQKAIKHPGALRRYAQRHGMTVRQLIANPPKDASPILKRRINLARTLMRLSKRKKRK